MVAENREALLEAVNVIYDRDHSVKITLTEQDLVAGRNDGSTNGWPIQSVAKMKKHNAERRRLAIGPNVHTFGGANGMSAKGHKRKCHPHYADANSSVQICPKQAPLFWLAFKCVRPLIFEN